jgi:hypothetical protein
MKYLSLFLAVLLFAACKNSTDVNSSEVEEQPENLAPLAAEHSFDALILDIDSKADSLSRVESLIYSKEDASNMEAVAYLDQSNAIVKVVEVSTDGKTGIRTIKEFYYKDGGKKFASRRSTILGEGENAYYSQLMSYYSPEGKATESKERVSDLEETIDQQVYREAPATEVSDDNAFEVLKQKGHYALTFQGFIENGPYQFLVVGENVSKDGYTSSLVIQEDSPTMRYLRKQGKAALGQEMEIQFQRFVDEMGYVTQILVRATLIERRKY